MHITYMIHAGKKTEKRKKKKNVLSVGERMGEHRQPISRGLAYCTNTGSQSAEALLPELPSASLEFPETSERES